MYIFKFAIEHKNINYLGINVIKDVEDIIPKRHCDEVNEIVKSGSNMDMD